MATPKNKKRPLGEFVNFDLQYLERKLSEMQKLVDRTPFDKIDDRYNKVKDDQCIATIEVQQKNVRETIITIAQLTEHIARLKSDQEIEGIVTKEVRGDSKLSPMDRGLLDEDDGYEKE